MSATAFRLEITFGDDVATCVWRPTGRELGAAPPMHRIPPFLVLEAMARCAGELLRRDDGREWMIAGVDDADLAPVATGADVTLTCRVVHRARGSARVTASAPPASQARLLMIARTFTTRSDAPAP